MPMAAQHRLQPADADGGLHLGRRRRRPGQTLPGTAGEPPPHFVRAGSPFFMFFLLEALAREGRFDELLKTIHDYWGVQIAAGATTCWETYHPQEARSTRSHCHGWSAAPVYFLSQYVLGVQPLAPGFRKILVAPRGNLEWCHGRAPTPAGTVECFWQRTGQRSNSG